jgi:hypothetical protein
MGAGWKYLKIVQMADITSNMGSEEPTGSVTTSNMAVITFTTHAIFSIFALCH